MKLSQPLSRGSRLLLALTFLLVSGALAARTKLVDSWQDKDAAKPTPELIAVIAVLPDALLRQVVEQDVAALLRKKGWNVIEGSNLPGLGGGIRGTIDTEAAGQALREAGADAVIAMFYTGGGVSGTYERADYRATYEGTAVGISWGQPYFVNVYSIHEGPGYADVAYATWVESTYYDLVNRQPVWRIVTETKDMEHSDAVKGISKRITQQMKKAGL